MATTDRIEIDNSQVAKLIVEMGHVPGKAVAAVDAVTKLSAEKVAQIMQADASGHETFPDFPKTITSGLRSFVGVAIEYEIGPDKSQKRVAALGNILYLGTSTKPPVLNLGVGIDAEGPAWAQKLASAGAGSLDDLGS